jgi:hypothetical protein
MEGFCMSGTEHWTPAQLAAYLGTKKPTKAEAAQQQLRAKGRLKTGERNKTEAAYERHLEVLKHIGKVLWFKFEGIKLRLADNTFLTVDFAVMNADGLMEMHDVKGGRAVFQDDAKAKMKIAADLYPFPFKVAFPKDRKFSGWEIEEIG